MSVPRHATLAHAPPLPAAMVNRGRHGILHGEGRHRPSARVPLFRKRVAAALVNEKAHPRRGVPDRGEHRQAAERAAADIEGYSPAAEHGQPGRLVS